MIKIVESHGIIKNFKQLPVFYHVPKNAGTYTITILRKVIFEGYASNQKNAHNILDVIIKDRKFIVARLVVNDKNSFLKTYHKCKFLNKITIEIEIEDLLPNLLNNLELLFVTIEPRGFNKKIVDIIQQLKIKYDLYKFIIFRKSFDRAQSLYRYIQSENSKHELTHKQLVSKTLEEYLIGEYTDGWVILSLLNLDMKTRVIQNHYYDACEILKDFNVFDVEYVDYYLQKIIKNCFNIKQFDFQANTEKAYRNGTSYDKITFEDLPQEIREKFNKRTYWDNMLYNTLINDD